jgi:hypothetical protein
MAEEVMKKMMDEFSAMGHKDDFNASIENMMKQLLAKDVMYTPMKQICEKVRHVRALCVWGSGPCLVCGQFPEWLAANESKLERSAYETYGRQFQCFQRLVNVYETTPDDFGKLMELMQDVRVVAVALLVTVCALERGVVCWCSFKKPASRLRTSSRSSRRG